MTCVGSYSTVRLVWHLAGLLDSASNFIFSMYLSLLIPNRASHLFICNGHRYILLQASVNKILGLSFLARFQGFSTNPLSPTKSLWTPDQVLNLGREERPLSKVYRIRRSSIPQLRQRAILNQTAQCLFKACIVLWLNWNEKTRF